MMTAIRPTGLWLNTTLLALAVASAALAGETDATGWVDPFLGTGETVLPAPEGIAAKWSCPKPRHGQLHPGATSPFGLVSVVPYGSGYPTGYWRGVGGRPCSGFTHFQQSGTGAIRHYYNYVRVAPIRGPLDFSPPAYVLTDEAAAPGSFHGVISSAGIAADVTVTRRAAFHCYVFSGAAPAHLVIDLAQAYAGPSVKIPARATAARFDLVAPNIAEGSIVIDGLPLYFHLEVEPSVAASGAWAGKARTPAPGPYGLSSQPFGVWFSFAPGTREAQLKIAFSFRSAAQARATLTEEMPSWDFAHVAAGTRAQWAAYLDRLRVEGGTREQRTIFYTALYRALIKPADATGENPFWESGLPWYVDFATLWDTYKTQMPLLMSFYPERGRDVVNALLNVAGHHGRFPVGYLLPDTLEFDDQGIDFAQIIAADAYAKGVTGIDWPAALPLLVHDLKTSGHYPDTALQFAYASACLVPVARQFGDASLVATLRAQAETWRTAFNPQTHKLPPMAGARPGRSFYEGGVWNYSFTVPHDMPGLIALYPSREAFVAELDRFFGFGDTSGVDMPFEGLNNQPDMEVPFAYIYAGRPDRTQAVIHAVRQYRFSTGRGGWPGNDDSGGTAAWYVWNALGLFPVAGRDLYLIGTPLFPRATLRINGGEFTIEARGLSEKAFYVASAELNGVPLDRAFLRHGELTPGGTLVLHMSEQPTMWGRAERPPTSRDATR